MVSSSGARTRVMILTGFMLASGCGGGDGATSAPTVAEVIVSVPPATIEAGDTVQLTAEAHNGSGGVIDGLTVVWTSSDPLVAAVEQDGRLRALVPGQAIITATISDVAGSETVAIQTPSVASVSLTPGPGLLVPGQTLGYQAIPRDKRGQPVAGKTVVWSTSVSGVATVSSDGVVTGVAPGQATVTARVDTAHAMAALTVNEGGVATPNGGTVSAFGGTFVLDIPAGAVTTVTPFRVTRLASPPLDPDYVGGSGFQLTPSLALTMPATVQLSYSPANGPLGLEEDQLGVHQLNGSDWAPAGGTTIDTAVNLARGSLGAVSIVGVHRLPAAAACTAPQHRQFDFWLGSWNFAAVGAFPGTDVVTADAQGCALREDFLDTSGFHSRSVSLYNARTGMWYQTFIDSQGGRILLSGGLVGNQMILNQTPTIRYLWTPVSAMQVTFSGEESGNGGATWSETFTSTYSR